MGWVVNATPQPFYPRERPGTHCVGGWLSPRAGLNGCEKSRPIGIRSPHCPGRSELLYRLRYPGNSQNSCFKNDLLLAFKMYPTRRLVLWIDCIMLLIGTLSKGSRSPQIISAVSIL
jgi:hypothetical protein